MNKQLKMLSKLFHYKHIDRSMVSRLYSLSQKSISAILVFSLILTYCLHPSLSSSIVMWELVLIILSLLRLYLSLVEKRDPDRFTMLTWYKIFLLGA